MLLQPSAGFDGTAERPPKGTKQVSAKVLLVKDCGLRGGSVDWNVVSCSGNVSRVTQRVQLQTSPTWASKAA